MLGTACISIETDVKLNSTLVVSDFRVLYLSINFESRFLFSRLLGPCLSLLLNCRHYESVDHTFVFVLTQVHSTYRGSQLRLLMNSDKTLYHHIHT